MRTAIYLPLLLMLNILLGQQNSQFPEITIGTLWNENEVYPIITNPNLNELDQLDYQILEHLKNKSNLKFKIIKFNTQEELLEALKTGKINMGTHNLAITPERLHDNIIFSYPYESSTVTIVGHYQPESSIKIVFKAFFSTKVMMILSVIVILSIIFGHILWYMERDRDENIISKQYIPGIFEASWHAFNIDWKVNLGDHKLHKTKWFTRFFSIPIWLCGMVLISILISELTYQFSKQDDVPEIELKQLENEKVTVRKTSYAEQIAKENALKNVTVYNTTTEQFKAFLNDKNTYMLIRKELALIEMNKYKNPENIRFFNTHIKYILVSFAYNKDFYFHNPELTTIIDSTILSLYNDGFIPKLEEKLIPGDKF